MQDHEELYKEVGRRIFNARKGRMTQEELASLVSLTRTSITNIEKGRQKFLLHTLADIARSLRVELVSLLPAGVSEPEKELEETLKDRPSSEKAWIKSAMISARKAGANDRS